MNGWQRAAAVVAAAGVGTGIARVVTRRLSADPPGGSTRWERENFRGRTVTLAAGAATAAGAAAGTALAPGLPARVRAAGILVAATAGAAGLYDDLEGSSATKGMHGHLRALARGEVTTGAVKVGAIGAAGLAASALVSDNALDALIGGAAVAGHANLLNLFDLRPGRAIKVSLLHAPVALGGAAGPVAAAGLGAAAAVLPGDLAERTMLGDAGANALGAVLGVALLAREGRTERLVHLAVVTALVLASEKVSFTQVIASNRMLRWLDELGRATQ